MDNAFFITVTNLRGNNRKIDRLNEYLDSWHHALLTNVEARDVFVKDMEYNVDMLNDSFPKSRKLHCRKCDNASGDVYVLIGIDGTDIACTITFNKARRFYP